MGKNCPYSQSSALCPALNETSANDELVKYKTEMTLKDDFKQGVGKLTL